MLAWYKEEHPLIYNISIFPLLVTEIALADATFFINVDKITLVMYAMWIFFFISFDRKLFKERFKFKSRSENSL